MFSREQFRSILEEAQQGRTAALEVETAGTVRVRLFRPAERLLLLGGGHVAQPVCHIAAMLGFAVTVADDRAAYITPARFPEAAARICAPFGEAIAQFAVGPGDYVAILTRGHQWDAACLRAVLRGTMPRYLGMIGSKRRVGAQRAMLAEEGIPTARIDALHAPIGLSIGALTPQEIAVSIAAELVQARRAGAPVQKSSVLQTEDTDLRLLEALCDDCPRAVLLVTEAEGSTPAKPGALMTVDATGATVGTIGGGEMEYAALAAARQLIGTGRSELLPLDLGGAVTGDAMACGGRATVLLADLP